MSAADKVKHAGQGTKGKVKAKVGALTGDERMQAEGEADQTAAGAKKTVDHVKDAAATAKDTAVKAKDAAKRTVLGTRKVRKKASAK